MRLFFVLCMAMATLASSGRLVSGNQVPGEDCPCAADYEPPFPCWWDLACFASYSTDPDDVEQINGGNTRTEMDKRVCNNCQNSQGRPGCRSWLEVSVTEVGSVTYSGSFSVGAKATINVLLAGGIGIEGTAAFQAGQTSSTSRKVTVHDECFVEDMPPCSRTDYWIEGSETRGAVARLPVTYAWYYRITGGPSGCSPSGWILATACEGVRYCTIQGGAAGVGGCRFKEVECLSTCCDEEQPAEQ